MAVRIFNQETKFISNLDNVSGGSSQMKVLIASDIRNSYRQKNMLEINERKVLYRRSDDFEHNFCVCVFDFISVSNDFPLLFAQTKLSSCTGTDAVRFSPRVIG